MRSALVVLAACVLTSGALGALPASATVVLVPTLEEMTHRSDVIVHAVVRDQQVFEKRKGKIVTRTILEVVDGLSGAKAGELVTVEQIGGSLDGRQMWIAGAHRFKVGDEVVFFGSKINDYFVAYGIGFGIFDVKDDVDGKHAVERGGDVVQLVRNAEGRTESKPVTPRHFSSLDAFKADLRAILDGRNNLGDATMKLAPRVPPLRSVPTTTTLHKSPSGG
ncbi:MAG: hypothetical protein Q8O67_12045 [Deltaproteobacteria bacterium]|nr:hypothetical protein [Deltaproteobacteria bacterium]